MDYYNSKAIEMREHLLKHKGSIVEIRVSLSAYDDVREVFKEVLGEELIRKVLFLVNREESHV